MPRRHPDQIPAADLQYMTSKEIMDALRAGQLEELRRGFDPGTVDHLPGCRRPWLVLAPDLMSPRQGADLVYRCLDCGSTGSRPAYSPEPGRRNRE